jgi:hypothetical protein
MRLIKLKDELFVYRLNSLERLDYQQVPSGHNSLFSLSVTGDEISLVSSAQSSLDVQSLEGPWIGYRVEGTLDFGLTGILHSLTGPLADAQISVFAISTFDTDYLLVRSDKASEAESAWSSSGVEL